MLTSLEKVEQKENIKILKQLIKDGKHLVAFVGAGVSTPLGIDTWDNLLKKMADTFHFQDDVQKLISRAGYAVTASQIYNHINDHNEYVKFLHQQFTPRNCRFTSLHSSIIKFFQTILTTNFDVSLELAARSAENTSLNIQKFPNFDPFNLIRPKTLVYLHGNNDDNKYILRKEEYDKYYPSVSKDPNGSYELENFLREVFKRLTLIFIGFSFKDSYFYQFLRKILHEEVPKETLVHKQMFRKEHSREQVDHFVIISNSNKGQIDNLRRMNLRTICYEEMHVRIEEILDEIFEVQSYRATRTIEESEDER